MAGSFARGHATELDAQQRCAWRATVTDTGFPLKKPSPAAARSLDMQQRFSVKVEMELAYIGKLNQNILVGAVRFISLPGAVLQWS